MTGGARWGFRARLTALIAGVFIVGGAVLLTVQYLLVQQLLVSGIATITSGCVSVEGSRVGGGPPDCLLLDGPTTGVGGTIEVTSAQTTLLSEEVLSGLLLWSIVVLAVFAVLAVLAAGWLSRRSLGRIARITSMTREITRDDLHRRLALPGPADEIKELGDTVDGMLDRLDEAFRRQDRFVAGASHELRTPLATTRTALEIPLAQGRFPADVEPEVRRALAANERSERLVAALLALARAAHAGGEDADGGTDLVAVVRDRLAELAGEAEGRGLAIEVAAVGPVLAAVEETLAEIAVGNLLDNAVRHGRDGGTIRVTAERAGADTVVTVENDGRVLADAEVARLAEPFDRGDRTRLSGAGTGLGLTLVDTVVRARGGRLDLAARAEGGLRAVLVLPAGDP